MQKLREEAQGSKEAEIINRAHDDNYEQKMSFNFAQKMAIKAVHDVMLNESSRKVLFKLSPTLLTEAEQLMEMAKSGYNDVLLKNSIDDFVKRYKELRPNFKVEGYHDSPVDLDDSILEYQKAFGVNEGPIVDPNVEKEIRRQEQVRILNNKILELEGLEQSLLEAKANAKVSILGRRDASSYAEIEEDLEKLKIEIAVLVSHNIEDYLGVRIDVSVFTK